MKRVQDSLDVILMVVSDAYICIRQNFNPATKKKIKKLDLTKAIKEVKLGGNKKKKKNLHYQLLTLFDFVHEL